MTAARFALLLVASLFVAGDDGSGAVDTEPNRRTLASLVPENSFYVMLVDDFPDFLDGWQSTPLGRTWNDPAVQKFFAPLRERMKLNQWEETVRESTGIEWSDMVETFTGEAVVAAFDPEILMSDEVGDGNIPILFLAEIGRSDDVVSRLMTLGLEQRRDEVSEGVQIESVEEEYLGETLHIWRQVSTENETEEMFWSVVDGIAILAGSRDWLQRTVARIKDDPAETPLDGEFHRMRDRYATHDLLLFVGIHSLQPVFDQAIKEMEEEQDPNSPAPPIRPEKVLDALGLDTIKAFALAARFDETILQIDSGLTFEGNRGLGRVLSAYLPGPITLPAFIPDEAVNASVGHVDFRAIWEAIRAIFHDMSPEFDGIINLQLQQIQSQIGMDLEQNLLGSLGDVMISVAFPPAKLEAAQESALPPQQDTLFGVSVRDRQGLDPVLEWIRNLAGGAGVVFESEEYLGHTIYTLRTGARPPQPDETAPTTTAQQFSYVLTDNFLFLGMGSPEPVRAILSHQQAPRRSIWNRPEIVAAFEVFPDNISGVGYQDSAAMLHQVFGALAFAQRVAGDDEEESESFCDPDALPDPDHLRRYLGVSVSATWRDGGGLFSSFRMLAAAP